MRKATTPPTIAIIDAAAVTNTGLEGRRTHGR